MKIDTLSMEELAVLTVVTHPLELLRVVHKAVDALPSNRFDHPIALRTISGLVGRMLLHRDGNMVEPTRRGQDAMKDTLEVVQKMKDSMFCQIIRTEW